MVRLYAEDEELKELREAGLEDTPDHEQ